MVKYTEICALYHFCVDLGIKCTMLQCSCRLLRTCPPPTLRRWCVANTVDTLGHPFLADATIAKNICCRIADLMIFAATASIRQIQEVAIMWLIDADDAKRTYTQDMFDTEEDFERVNDVLDYAPTVDAVVVTRCKDCKHSTLPSALTQRYGVPGTLTCHNRYSPCNRRNVGGEDFCSYGERREE